MRLPDLLQMLEVSSNDTMGFIAPPYFFSKFLPLSRHTILEAILVKEHLEGLSKCLG